MRVSDQFMSEELSDKEFEEGSEETYFGIKIYYDERQFNEFGYSTSLIETK